MWPQFGHVIVGTGGLASTISPRRFGHQYSATGSRARHFAANSRAEGRPSVTATVRTPSGREGGYFPGLYPARSSAAVAAGPAGGGSEATVFVGRGVNDGRPTLVPTVDIAGWLNSPGVPGTGPAGHICGGTRFSNPHFGQISVWPARHCGASMPSPHLLHLNSIMSHPPLVPCPERRRPFYRRFADTPSEGSSGPGTGKLHSREFEEKVKESATTSLSFRSARGLLSVRWVALLSVPPRAIPLRVAF